MKKITLIITMTALMALLLSSCGLINKIKDSLSGKTNETESGTVDEELGKIESVLTGDVDLDSLSLEELLELTDVLMEEDGNAAALNGGTEAGLMSGSVYDRADDPEAEADFSFGPDAQTAVLSDDSWVTDKAYEALDVTANMSPEDKAALTELENFNYFEFQAGIDEMVSGIEGLDDDASSHATPDVQEGDTQILNEWPENALTSGVPKPPFTRGIITASSDNVAMVVSGVAAADVKAYAASVKNAGFDQDANESDQSISGMDIYSYTAGDGSGRTITIAFTAGTFQLSISQ